MMINLFSTFDPATSFKTSFNWASLITPMIILPTSLWIFPSQQQMFTNIIKMKICKELQAMKMTNPKGLKVIPFSILWFIMVSNTSGLLPYSFTSTSHITTTLSLALTLWISLTLFGWLMNTKHMLSHMLPLGTPTQLMAFMVCIETISTMIRPITLAVRLSANMIAGHLLITLMSNTMINLQLHFLILSMTAELTLMLLETAVALIQSYVFMTLTMLYLSEAN